MVSEICVVAPYEQLVDTVRQVNCECQIPVDVRLANLEAAVSLLPELEAAGYRVLISRGKTAELLRSHSALPVFDIKISSFDVVRALGDLVGKPIRVGVAGHRAVVRDCAKMAEMLGIVYHSIVLNEDEAYEDLRERASTNFSQHPIDILVGDTIPQKYFNDLCGEFRLISSGPESVAETIESARALLQALNRENSSRSHLATVLDMFEKVVFSLDPLGRISHANRAAERVFQISRADLLGRPIESVDPVLRVARDTLADGIWDVGQVVETQQGPMVCYQYPYEGEGHQRNIVFALERVEHLFTVAQKVRRQEQRKGRFLAQYHFDDYQTNSPQMQAGLKLLTSYAQTDATILVIGETGTGKELLAQGIHNSSPRRDGPFVAVNCGALPSALLESELFGYVEGAFTGASRKGKKGLFELAHTGTLFLDEISELDKTLQTRLLRVIQERQLMRLGSEEIIPVDIRIVAAANKDLETMVADGSFRQDLYYRLNVLKFEPQPLRERPQDIIPIALSMLRKHAHRYGRQVVDLDAEVREFLVASPWPGNLRQLSNVMERIAIISPEAVATMATAGSALTDLRPTLSQSPECRDCMLLDGGMDTIRRRVVNLLMTKEDNQKVRVAKRLGVDRGTLNRWLKEN